MGNNRTNTRSIKTMNKILLILLVSMGVCCANVLFTMVTGIHFRSGVNVVKYAGGSEFKSNIVYASRGSIYDTNNEVIAQDVETYNLYAIISDTRKEENGDAAYVTDYEKTSKKLAPILNCKPSEIYKYFEAAKKNNAYQTEFGKLGKNLSNKQKEKIEKLNISGLGFTEGSSRIYPVKKFASQLIGYASNDPTTGELKGVMGIEKYLDKNLRGQNGILSYKMDSQGNYLPDTKSYLKEPVDGNDVYLTIDKNVQVSLEKALSNTMKSNKAEKAWGIVMNAKTGEIMAQAGYPTFDLNKRDSSDNYYNLPSEWAYECGSVMKPFIYAAAMNEGVYNGSELFKSGSAIVGTDKNGKLVRVDEKGYGEPIATINDALGHNYGYVSYDEGLIRSLNTGIVNIVIDKLGLNKEYKYLKKFGFGKPVGIKGVNENPGVLSDRTPLDRVMTGFGQSSTINSYQLVQAYSAIFGDGKMVKPYLINKIVDKKTGKVVYQGKTKKSEEVIKPSVAKKVRTTMKEVVSSDIGSGHSYQMDDVVLSAKTGTGQIARNGEYSKTIYTSSICAGYPADDPQVIFYYAFQSSNIIGYNTDYFKDVVRESLIALGEYTGNDKPDPNATNPDNRKEFDAYILPNMVNHDKAFVEEKLANSNVEKVYLGNGNTIISQYPYENQTVFTGQKVLFLTDGKNISMPDLTGWTRKDVEAFAKMTGIQLMIRGNGVVTSQSIKKDTVITPNQSLVVELR